ncbi:MAG: ribose 5-phosphate isomerase A, partial [Burkholderiaceae bacterium]
MNQDDLKRAVARAAIDHLEPGALVGVGGGPTVTFFTDALGAGRDRVAGGV